MKVVLLKILRITLGLVFLILGFLGLFLPVLQGILFLAIGFFLLSIDLPFFHRIVTTFESRFPRLKEHLEGWRKHWGKKHADGGSEA